MSRDSLRTITTYKSKRFSALRSKNILNVLVYILVYSGIIIMKKTNGGLFNPLVFKLFIIVVLSLLLN